MITTGLEGVNRRTKSRGPTARNIPFHLLPDIPQAFLSQYVRDETVVAMRQDLDRVLEFVDWFRQG